MAIAYPVDTESTRWAVYQVSTGLVIARNKQWPVADGGAIPGMDPDYVYLRQITDTAPDYDARLFRLVGEEAVDVEANELRRTWTVEAIPAEDVKAEIINEESVRFGRIAKIEQALTDVYIMTMATAAVVKDNEAFHPKAAAMYPDMLARAVKLFKNRSRREALEAAADAGTVQTADLDTGWEDQ